MQGLNIECKLLEPLRESDDISDCSENKGNVGELEYGSKFATLAYVLGESSEFSPILVCHS